MGDETKAGEKQWRRVLERLSAEEGRETFRDWLSHLSFERMEKDRVHLLAPTQFMARWISTHYETALLRGWLHEAPGIRRVIIKGAEGAKRADASPKDSGRKAPLVAAATLDTPLNPALIFDSFVGGQENLVALRASKRIALLEKRPALRSPLFLHGAAGFGKTHLMNAIALAIEERGGETFLFTSADRFRYHFVKALRAKDAIAFKDPFYELDVFLLDDLHFLTGEATQREFGHFLDTLLAKGARIVLSADRPPSALDIFPPRLRSLMASGLITEIQPAPYELRLKILRAKMPRAPEGVRMPPNVLEFLAKRVTTNIRELEGALHNLITHAELGNATISLEWAKIVLRDALRGQTPKITVDKIQRVVAEHYGMSREELLGRSRQQSIVRPRQIAIFMAKRLTQRSLPDLGRRFGNRDHTTIIHAVRRIETLSEKDEQIRSEIAHFTRILKN